MPHQLYDENGNLIYTEHRENESENENENETENESGNGNNNNNGIDVGIPDTNDLSDSAVNWATGLGGGIAYLILGRVSNRFIGTPIVGSAISGIGSGAIVGGTQGQTIAVTTGFNAALSDPFVNGMIDNALGVVGFDENGEPY